MRSLPRTYRPSTPDDGARRPRLFDPALQQFRSAFRSGDPAFDDADAGRRWAEVRRRATDHVLRRVAESLWGDRLVLRGSRLLSAWLGPAAREPGDLDWVVDPPSARLTDPESAVLFDGLAATVVASPDPVGIEWVRGGVAVDDIWTYERAPGRRVVFPWRSAGLPGGAVQVDVVFGEHLEEPARWLPVPAADGGCVSVRAASPAQSLAWKLLWLETDMYPQGKDLYDAVLLAERFALPWAVLEDTLCRGGSNRLPETATALVEGWRAVDWSSFRAEYPWVDGDVGEWLNRLVGPLEPTFFERPGWDASVREAIKEKVRARQPSGTTFDLSWLTPTVVAIAAGIEADRAFDGLPILADALEEAGCDDAELLAHCRRNGPHARGCWVIDRILGRS
jgi:hypothetical protein